MWLQQRLKGLPGLLSSSWARRLLCLLGLLVLLLWFASSGARRAAGGLHLPSWARSEPGAAEPSACLEAATRAWRGLRDRGEAVPLGPGVPALVANGFLALDASNNRLWVTPGEREPAVTPDFVPFVQLRPLNVVAEAGEAVLLLREGLLRRVRCLQLGTPGSGPAAGVPGPASASGLSAGSGRDCVLLQEDFLAHRGRPHVYLQRIQLSFGGLQFTENHLQFQADPEVLHNSYALHGIRYKNDHINLAVLVDAEGKPYLHVSLESRGQPVKIYACEAGCLHDPVELTSEPGGHTFSVMVTQPITPQSLKAGPESQMATLPGEGVLPALPGLHIASFLL